MPMTIIVRFMTGRAHLHHWQAHHSDGKIDWPPSHWRLLRALVAVAGRGHTSLPPPDFVIDPPKKPRVSKKKPPPPWPPDDYVALPDNWYGLGDVEDGIPISRLTSLLSVLATAPEIWLPKTSGGHTRQFFPIHEGGIVKPSGSAVFDTFAVVARDQPVLFHWPNVHWVSGDNRLADLKTILSHMTYFGRAESWCQASIELAAPSEIQGVSQDVTHWRCVCIEDCGKPPGREYLDYTLDRKLAPLAIDPDHPSGLADEVWKLLPRTTRIAPNRSKKSEEFEQLLRTERSEILLFRCLLRESGDDMKDGLERPIGTRWVHYAVPRAIYYIPHAARPKPTSRPECVQVVRYSLNTATVNQPVLPLLADTLLVADKFRNAVLALHHLPSRNLSGHETNGSPCVDNDHSFYWPTDEDNDGFIDHVTVFCRRGFDRSEVRALHRLVRIRQRGGRPDLLVTPVYAGSLESFPLWASDCENGTRGETCIFVSATPYFCPVHLSHGRGKAGRLRPITQEILKGMKLQNIIADESEVRSIGEIIFDYAPEELKEIAAAISAGRIREPVPPRQFFPLVKPGCDFPPLPSPFAIPDRRYVGAFLKNPDRGFPFGLTIGLLVDKGTRFVRAMSFCRKRGNKQPKTFGRMFCIEFVKPRQPQPFAIGDQCHFGLGLFVSSRMVSS